MASIPAAVGDMFQVRVKGFQEGQETNNVLHFVCSAASSDVDLHLIQVLIQCFVTHLLPAWSANWTLDTVVWKRVSPTLSPEFVSSATTGVSGAVVTDSLPTFNAALVSIRTAQGGRSKRGRMFLAGIPESGTIKSSFDLAGLPWLAILAFVACIVDKFIDNGELGSDRFTLGVYSRKIGGAAFPYGAAGFTPAVSMNAVALVATMRSRKVGRGS